MKYLTTIPIDIFSCPDEIKLKKNLIRYRSKKNVTGGGEEGVYPKIVTNGDMNGGGHAQMVTSAFCIL